MEHTIEHPSTVSYLTHESDMARSDRRFKQVWLTLNGVLAVIFTMILIGMIRSIKYETSKGRNS